MYIKCASLYLQVLILMCYFFSWSLCTLKPLQLHHILRISAARLYAYQKQKPALIIQWSLLRLSASSGVCIGLMFRDGPRNVSSVQYRHLTRLIAQEDCIKFSCLESSRTCIDNTLATDCRSIFSNRKGL